MLSSRPTPGSLPPLGQVGQDVGGSRNSCQTRKTLGIRAKSFRLPIQSQEHQGRGVSGLGRLESLAFGELLVPGCQSCRAVAVYGLSTLESGTRRVFRFLGRLPPLRLDGRVTGPTDTGGPLQEVMGPLQPMPVTGGGGEVVEIVRLGEMCVGGVPEGRGRADPAASGAAVLFDVVGETEHRTRGWLRCHRCGQHPGRATRGAYLRTTQGGLFPVHGTGKVSERGLRPVLGELVVVVIGEVVGGGVDEEGLREVESDSETAGVHRGLEQSSDRRGAVFVAAQELRGAGEVLCDPSMGVRSREGIRDQPVTVPGERRGGTESLLVEDVGDRNGASGQELPDPAVRVGLTGAGQNGVRVGVLGPQGAQDEDRSTLRLCEKRPEGRRDPLAGLGVA